MLKYSTGENKMHVLGCAHVGGGGGAAILSGLGM